MAQIGGEEEAGDGAPDEVEDDSALNVSPRHRMASKHGAHAFKDWGAGQRHGDGLHP